MKNLFWNDLSLKDKFINIGCLIFAILMFKISRVFFYIIFGYLILMLGIKYVLYFNRIDELKYQSKKNGTNGRNRT